MQLCWACLAQAWLGQLEPSQRLAPAWPCPFACDVVTGATAGAGCCTSRIRQPSCPLCSFPLLSVMCMCVLFRSSSLSALVTRT